jgi:hypothetical protein
MLLSPASVTTFSPAAPNVKAAGIWNVAFVDFARE